MSKYLNEQAVLDKVDDKITGYGRIATFIDKDKNEYQRYITPPRNTKRLSPDGNAQEELLVCLISNKDLAFDVKRLMRMVHRGSKHQIISFDSIESGDLIQAYKIYLER